MIYEEVLLIGGSSDGLRISVMKDIPEILRPVRMSYPVSIGECQRKPEPKVFDIEVYRRYPLSGSSGLSGSVYVIAGIDPLAALIAGYRAPSSIAASDDSAVD